MKEIIDENAWLIVFILFTILGCLFSGCRNMSDQEIQEALDAQSQIRMNIAKDAIYGIKVIEGCEYFVVDGYLRSINLVHKGNCSNPIHKCICK